MSPGFPYPAKTSTGHDGFQGGGGERTHSADRLAPGRVLLPCGDGTLMGSSFLKASAVSGCSRKALGGKGEREEGHLVF